MRTTGLRILVTGGGSGIGLAVARRLATDNSVVIAGRDEGRLARAVADAPLLRAQVLDVTSEDDARRAIDRITDDLGGLDLVIHAAGVMHAFDISDPTAAEFTAREIDTNLLGSERVARLTLPILRRSDTAALVLISSVVALVPAPGFAVYSATKAAVHSLAHSLRHEVSPRRHPRRRGPADVGRHGPHAWLRRWQAHSGRCCRGDRRRPCPRSRRDPRRADRRGRPRQPDQPKARPGSRRPRVTTPLRWRNDGLMLGLKDRGQRIAPILQWLVACVRDPG